MSTVKVTKIERPVSAAAVTQFCDEVVRWLPKGHWRVVPATPDHLAKRVRVFAGSRGGDTEGLIGVHFDEPADEEYNVTIRPATLFVAGTPLYPHLFGLSSFTASTRATAEAVAKTLQTALANAGSLYTMQRLTQKLHAEYAEYNNMQWARLASYGFVRDADEHRTEFFHGIRFTLRDPLSIAIDRVRTSDVIPPEPAEKAMTISMEVACVHVDHLHNILPTLSGGSS